jgi:hypothetical protein
MRRRAPVALALALASVIVACGEEPPVESMPIEVTDAEQGFELTLSIPSGRFAANEPIDARASLTWAGPEPARQLWAAAQGPILFWLVRVDDQWQLGPASDAACATYDLRRGVPDTRPFEKMLGWSGDDPQAAFYRAYADDPLLRPPPGRWRIFAAVEGYLAPCAADAPRLELRTEADVLVE